MLSALEGKISARELRVMLEHLPNSNPIVWESQGHQWTDLHYMVRDVANTLRLLYTGYANVNRRKGTPEMEPKLLPTPEEILDGSHTESDERTPEQVQAERDHLQRVLNRKRKTP